MAWLPGLAGREDEAEVVVVVVVSEVSGSAVLITCIVEWLNSVSAPVRLCYY